MTPLDSGVDLGEPPAARLTPPMASNAMNVPTAAVAPFRTFRRVAPPSPAGVVRLPSMSTWSPPLASPARDHDALDEQPHDGQAAEREDVRADNGGQEAGLVRPRRDRLDNRLRNERLRPSRCGLGGHAWF